MLSRKLYNVLGSFLIAFLFIVMLLAIHMYNPTNAETLTRFEGGTTAIVPISQGVNNSVNISINKHANVTISSLNIRGMPATDGGNDYPRSPALYIGDSTTASWRFAGPGYGSLGLQDTFEDDSTSSNYYFATAGESSKIIKLPKSEIESANFSISTNNDIYNFTFQIGSTKVWERASFSFASPRTLNVAPSNPTSVAVGDIDGNNYADFVAGNGSGYFIIARNYGGEITEKTSLPAGNGEITGVALADVNSDGLVDIVGSCANGNFYILRNIGGGAFDNAESVYVGPGDLKCVAVGDINGDTYPDLVGGCLNGSIAICFNNEPSPGNFSSPIFNTTAPTTNIVWAIALGNVEPEGDTDLDVVAASNNGNFYVLKNADGVLCDAETVIPANPAGIEYMRTVTLADIDLDGDLDIIGGNRDKGIYISTNSNGFLSPYTLLCGAKTTGQIMAVRTADLNNDTLVDILAVTSDTQGAKIEIYVNNLSIPGSFSKGLSIYPGQPYISSCGLADFDSDGYVDIGCVGNNAFVWMLNNAGSFSTTLSGSAIVSALQNALNSASSSNDAYGNPICTIELRVSSRTSGNLTINSFCIKYNYTAQTSGFQAALNNYLQAHKNEGPRLGNNSVPFKFTALSSGRIFVSNLNLVFKIEEPIIAYISTPQDGYSALSTNLTLFSGYSNRDPSGSELNYTWKINGTPFAYGSNTYQRLPPGEHEITLTVTNLTTGEYDSKSINVSISKPPVPSLKIVSLTSNKKSGMKDDKITFTVSVKNSGTVDAKGITVKLFLGNSATPFAWNDIPNIRAFGNVTTTIIWAVKAKVGNYKISANLTTTDESVIENAAISPITFKVTEKTGTDMSLILVLVLVIVGVVALVGASFVLAKKDKEKKERKARERERIIAEQQAQMDQFMAPQQTQPQVQTMQPPIPDYTQQQMSYTQPYQPQYGQEMQPAQYPQYPEYAPQVGPQATAQPSMIQAMPTQAMPEQKPLIPVKRSKPTIVKKEPGPAPAEPQPAVQTVQEPAPVPAPIEEPKKKKPLIVKKKEDEKQVQQPAKQAAQKCKNCGKESNTEVCEECATKDAIISTARLIADIKLSTDYDLSEPDAILAKARAELEKKNYVQARANARLASDLA
ncbi:MAG: FG-GAP-like repeat-containing protein, partial [Thermoplasmata archaeon]